MEMKDKIYFYNPKYPEYGIEELPIENVEWVSNLEGKRLYMHGVTSKYDIETGETLDYIMSYRIYCPYEEDDDMFMYDLPGNRERILSFNRAKLEEWWYEDVKTRYNIMKKRMEDLEKCLNQK